jgi:hypothetical protein
MTVVWWRKKGRRREEKGRERKERRKEGTDMYALTKTCAALSRSRRKELPSRGRAADAPKAKPAKKKRRNPNKFDLARGAWSKKCSNLGNGDTGHSGSRMKNGLQI